MYTTCKLRDLQSDDQRIACLIDRLKALENINALLGPEFKAILDDTLVLNDGEPILQYRDGVCWPFLHDLLPFTNLRMTRDLLDVMLVMSPTPLEGFNLYGARDLRDSWPELAVDTEVHVFPCLRAGESVLEHLNSKQRNAIGDLSLPGGIQFEPVQSAAALAALIPSLCSSWVLKHNVDDVWNIVQEWMTWLWMVENMRTNTGRVFALHCGGTPVALMGFSSQDGQWVYQAFWQMPAALAAPQNLPSAPMGTLMLAHCLDVVARAGDVLLTWPSFLGDTVQPYEAYKRKFSVRRDIVRSYFGTNGQGYSPYYNMNTGEVE